MKIEWLNTRIALENAGLQEAGLSLFAHDLNEEQSNLKLISLVFLDRSALTSFANAFEAFTWPFQNLLIQAGICTDKIKEANDDTSLQLDNPIVFFGSDSQQENYDKYLNTKKVFVQNSCNSTVPTVAYQRHMSSMHHIKSISLGEFRSNFDKAESLMRAAQTIVFNINAIRKQDSFSKNSPLTGLDIYEACQLLRFCGLNTQHGFLFYNIGHRELDEDTWQCIATTMWYYFEGITQQQVEDIDQRENSVYIVENSLFNEAITFIKGYQTNRWWFVHPESNEKVPCSEEDYKALRDGNIPDILLSICVE